MHVVVVAKTKIKDMLCVGGLSKDGCKGLRLLQANGHNQPSNTPFQIGENLEDRWTLAAGLHAAAR
jgi:hypothetical protein